MIRRNILRPLERAANTVPAVVLTGPRQSGKTTACRGCFPDHAYVSLKPLDVRDFAISDPRGFLSQYAGPVVIDEVQHAPVLFSHLQEAIDADPTPGRFVLIVSPHSETLESMTRSLAGRMALLQLLPLSLDERARFGPVPDDHWTVVWAGAYPLIHDRGLDPSRWLADYAATWVQSDVRQVLRVSDLESFTRFMRLLAARTAQELNLSALGAAVGVSHPTIQAWVDVLEASFLVFRLPPWLRNVRKRVVKSPKLHFIDSGLACHLLGIRSPDQLRTHPLRGALFESWVSSEIRKARLHARRPVDLFHLRETRGAEIDVLVGADARRIAVKVESRVTAPSEQLATVRRFTRRAAAVDGPEIVGRVVYGGRTRQQRGEVDAIPWRDIQRVRW